MVLKLLGEIGAALASIAARLVEFGRKLFDIATQQQQLRADIDGLAMQLREHDRKLDAALAMLAAIKDSVVSDEATQLSLRIHYRGETYTGEFMPILHKGDSYSVTVEPQNALGARAPIDGPITFSATPAEAVDIVVDAAGNSATITAKAISGTELATFSVQAEADADLGPGIRKLVAVSTGSVVPDGLEATVLALTEGPVTPAPTV